AWPKARVQCVKLVARFSVFIEWIEWGALVWMRPSIDEIDCDVTPGSILPPRLRVTQTAALTPRRSAAGFMKRAADDGGRLSWLLWPINNKLISEMDEVKDILASEPTRLGERRQVSVLFTDMVGYT